MYYPYRIVLPSNILKLIPLYIKQTWVHYPNLCAELLPDFLQGLTSMKTNPNNPERKESRVHERKIKTGREFRFNAHIDDYEIIYFMLYLGFDVNILPNKTWEEMENPKLQPK
jgi:hypothetical protein